MRSSERRHGRRGQALTEFAISAPLLIVFAFGVWDIGRWVNYGAVASGSAQAGVHQFEVCNYSSALLSNCASNGNTYNFGSVIYTSDPKTVPNWGLEGSGPVSYNCDSTSTSCGDPQGCSYGDIGWPPSTSQVMGCFAIGYCTANLGAVPPTCSTPTWCATPWATSLNLPAECAKAAKAAGTLVVKVVIRAPAISPVGFALANSGYFFIARQYYGSVTF
jgi:hypothetical protein